MKEETLNQQVQDFYNSVNKLVHPKININKTFEEQLKFLGIK